MLRFNGVTEKRNFETWAADHGIEVVTSWDSGMYGNLTYKVRYQGKLLFASAYQSLHGNFTFDLNPNSVECANDRFGCDLKKGQVPVKPGDVIHEPDGRVITVGHWVANSWQAWDQDGKPIWNYRRAVHPQAA